MQFGVGWRKASVVCLLSAWLHIGWLGVRSSIAQDQVADIAFSSSRQGQAIAQAREARFSSSKLSVVAKWSAVWRKTSEQQRSLVCCISREWEEQVRFEAAVAALRLHYGIAACQMGLEILDRADDYVREQSLVQEELLDQGGQVEDTSAINRSRIGLKDRRLQLESRQSQLRDQLSLLVGADTACAYVAQFRCAPAPELHDRCEYESWAVQQRFELRVLRCLRNHLDWINQDALDMLTGLSITPEGLLALLGPVERTSLLGHKTSSDQVTKHRKSLDGWIALRGDQIRVEVSQAYSSKELAAQRWRLGIEMTDALQERYERLETLSEVKGNLPQQNQVRIELFESQGEEIQRWLEWHLADCDLQLASGRMGFWKSEEQECIAPAGDLVKDESR